VLRALTVPEPGFSSLLQKEAVYCAVGLTAPTICEALDFKAFLTEKLVPEVQIQQPEYKIIRRRIAILVGEWAPIESVKECLPICFQICQFLLNKDDPLNDQVVRVAAGRQLNNAVLAYGAEPGDLRPYMNDIIQQLIFVIEEVDLPETKNMILHTLGSIVERMEELVRHNSGSAKLTPIDHTVC
jgi:hypothetical protein